ncbi:MAG: hypothetical protein ABIH11_07440 [Candidatus Altiarchaeota archaeon]
MAHEEVHRRETAVYYPTLMPIVVAPGNKRLYEEMQGRLDSMTQATASVGLQLNQGVMERLTEMGLTPEFNARSFRYRHTVYEEGKQDGAQGGVDALASILLGGGSHGREIHLNEVLDAEGKSRYGLATVFGGDGSIQLRCFANPEMLGRLREDMPESGYQVREFSTFTRTHMRVGRIDLFTNIDVSVQDAEHSWINWRKTAGVSGRLEAGVFDEDPMSVKGLLDFVTHLGFGQEMGVGGHAGPITGRGSIAALRLTHRAPPPIVDLSIPENHRQFIEAIGGR